ncbi:MAG TPA: molecular chaperone HtpG [Blastocatellia bacterium]|nr:molecular chaperone HtpG [Blastocatellia bacterium]
MAQLAEELGFQAETKQLLDIVINSLYTSKEVFLRELISNASDALDRLRFESLTDPTLLEDDSRLEIRVDWDAENRTLTVSDSGIGMSRAEVIANIGTIAKSGTRELRERAREESEALALGDFIGQFGVGFYSAFIVSDKVSLVTRKAGEAGATRWESASNGVYVLSAGSRATRGTTVTLHLKPVDAESGGEDYMDPWVLSRIIKRYSDFISYPIICKFPGSEPGTVEKGTGEERSGAVRVFEEKIVNAMTPIWTKPHSEVSAEEYANFYRHISHAWEPALRTIHLKAEGMSDYQALLFIPSRAGDDLFYHASESGLRLYAKRVMVMERCTELLPRYLRFITGVVDSADLPLNISRQTLQQDRHFRQMQKWLTKKVLDDLRDVMEKDFDQHLAFWKEFGRALKEGVASDYENKERILGLLLFASSNDPENLTTLRDYVSRMRPAQEEIYYLTGETRSIIERSPHLEKIQHQGYEVLYLSDPVDELLVQTVSEYEGKRLKSARKGNLAIGSDEEQKRAEEELKERELSCSDLLEFVQRRLDAYVKQVRVSNRLVSSAVCLVGTEIDYSPQLERLLLKGKGGGPRQRRIMELNPNHEIFQKMLKTFEKDGANNELGDYAELLFGIGLLAEGSELADPVGFNDLVARLIVKVL